MRRGLFGGGVGDIGAGADLLFHLAQLAGEQVDLLPLAGDGVVQFLYGVVLEGDAGFERFEAFEKGWQRNIGHDGSPGSV